jgi:hypothetical protein
MLPVGLELVGLSVLADSGTARIAGTDYRQAWDTMSGSVNLAS